MQSNLSTSPKTPSFLSSSPSPSLSGQDIKQGQFSNEISPRKQSLPRISPRVKEGEFSKLKTVSPRTPQTPTPSQNRSDIPHKEREYLTLYPKPVEVGTLDIADSFEDSRISDSSSASDEYEEIAQRAKVLKERSKETKTKPLSKPFNRKPSNSTSTVPFFDDDNPDDISPRPRSQSSPAPVVPPLPITPGMFVDVSADEPSSEPKAPEVLQESMSPSKKQNTEVLDIMMASVDQLKDMCAHCESDVQLVLQQQSNMRVNSAVVLGRAFRKQSQYSERFSKLATLVFKLKQQFDELRKSSSRDVEGQQFLVRELASKAERVEHQVKQQQDILQSGVAQISTIGPLVKKIEAKEKSIDSLVNRISHFEEMAIALKQEHNKRMQLENDVDNLKQKISDLIHSNESSERTSKLELDILRLQNEFSIQADRLLQRDEDTGHLLKELQYSIQALIVENQKQKQNEKLAKTTESQFNSELNSVKQQMAKLQQIVRGSSSKNSVENLSAEVNKRLLEIKQKNEKELQRVEEKMLHADTEALSRLSRTSELLEQLTGDVEVLKGSLGKLTDSQDRVERILFESEEKRAQESLQNQQQFMNIENEMTTMKNSAIESISRLEQMTKSQYSDLEKKISTTIDDLTTDIGSSYIKVDDYERGLNSISEKERFIQDQIALIQQGLDNLSRTQQTTTTTIQTKAEEVEGIKDAHTELKQNVGRLDSSHRKFESDFKEFKLGQAQREQLMNQKANDLEKNVSRIELGVDERFNQVTKQVTGMKDSIQHNAEITDSKLNELKRNHEEAQSSNVKAFNTVQDSIQRLELESSDLETKLNNVENVFIARFEDVDIKYSAQGKDIEAVKAKLSVHDQQIDQLATEINTVQHRLDKGFHDISKSLNDFEVTVNTSGSNEEESLNGGDIGAAIPQAKSQQEGFASKLKQDFAKLEVEISTLKQMDSKFQGLLKEISTMRTKLEQEGTSNHEEVFAQLMLQYGNLDTKFRDLQTKQTSIHDSLANEIASVYQRIVELNKAVSGDLESSEKKIRSEIENNIRTVTSQVEKISVICTNEIAKHTNQVTNEINRSKQAVDEMQSTIEAVKHQLEEELDTVASDVQKVVALFNKQGEELQTYLKESISSYQRQLNDKLQHITTTISEMERRASQNNLKIEQLESVQMVKLGQDMQAISSKADSLFSEYSDKLSEISKLVEAQKTQIQEAVTEAQSKLLNSIAFSFVDSKSSNQEQTLLQRNVQEFKRGIYEQLQTANQVFHGSLKVDVEKRLQGIEEYVKQVQGQCVSFIKEQNEKLDAHTKALSLVDEKQANLNDRFQDNLKSLSEFKSKTIQTVTETFAHSQIVMDQMDNKLTMLEHKLTEVQEITNEHASTVNNSIGGLANQQSKMADDIITIKSDLNMWISNRQRDLTELQKQVLADTNQVLTQRTNEVLDKVEAIDLKVDEKDKTVKSCIAKVEKVGELERVVAKLEKRVGDFDMLLQHSSEKALEQASVAADKVKSDISQQISGQALRIDKLQRQLQEHTNFAPEFESKLQRALQENNELVKESIEKLKENMEQNITQVESMVESEKTIAQKETADLKQLISKMEQEIGELGKQTTGAARLSEEEKSHLAKQIDDLSGTVLTKSVETEREMEKLKAELKGQDSKVEQLEKNFTPLRDSINNLEQLLQVGDKSKNEFRSQVSSQLEMLDSRIIPVEVASKELDSKIKQLEAQKESMASDLRKLIQENEQHQEQKLVTTAEKLSHVDQRIQELQGAKQANESRLHEIEERVKPLEDYRTQVDTSLKQLTSQTDTVRTSIMLMVEEERERLSKHAAQQEQQLTSLKSKLSEMQQSCATTETVQQLRLDLSSTGSSLKLLEDKVAPLAHSHKELEENQQAVNTSLKNLSDQTAEAKSIMSELIEKESSRISRLEEHQEKELENLKQQHEIVQKKLEELQNAEMKESLAIQGITKRIAPLETSQLGIHAKLDASVSDIANLVEKTKSMEINFASLIQGASERLNSYEIQQDDKWKKLHQQLADMHQNLISSEHAEQSNATLKQVLSSALQQVEEKVRDLERSQQEFVENRLAVDESVKQLAGTTEVLKQQLSSAVDEHFERMHKQEVIQDQQLAVLNDQMAKISLELELVQGAEQNSSAQIRQVEERIKPLESQFAKVDSLADLDSSVASLKYESEVLKETIKDLVKQQDAIKESASSNAENLEHHQATVNSKLLTLDSATSVHAAKLEDLKSSTETLSRQVLQAEQAQLKATQQIDENKQTIISTVQPFLERMTEAESKAAHLDAKVNKLQDEHNNQSNNISEMQKTIHDNALALDTFSSQVELVKSSQSNLSSRMSVIEDSCASMANEIERNTNSIQEISSRTDKAISSITDVENLSKMVESRLSSFADEQNAKDDIYSNALEELKHNLTNKTNQETFKTFVAQTQQQLEKQEKRTSLLEEGTLAKQDEIDKIVNKTTQEVSHLQAKAEEIAQTVAETNRSFSETTAKLEEQQKTIQLLAGDLVEAKRTVNELATSSVQQSQQRISEVEQTVEDVRQDSNKHYNSLLAQIAEVKDFQQVATKNIGEIHEFKKDQALINSRNATILESVWNSMRDESQKTEKLILDTRKNLEETEQQLVILDQSFNKKLLIMQSSLDETSGSLSNLLSHSKQVEQLGTKALSMSQQLEDKLHHHTEEQKTINSQTEQSLKILQESVAAAEATTKSMDESLASVKATISTVPEVAGIQARLEETNESVKNLSRVVCESNLSAIPTFSRKLESLDADVRSLQGGKVDLMLFERYKNGVLENFSKMKQAMNDANALSMEQMMATVSKLQSKIDELEQKQEEREMWFKKKIEEQEERFKQQLQASQAKMQEDTATITETLKTGMHTELQTQIQRVEELMEQAKKLQTDISRQDASQAAESVQSQSIMQDLAAVQEEMKKLKYTVKSLENNKHDQIELNTTISAIEANITDFEQLVRELKEEYNAVKATVNNQTEKLRLAEATATPRSNEATSQKSNFSRSIIGASVAMIIAVVVASVFGLNIGSFSNLLSK